MHRRTAAAVLAAALALPAVATGASPSVTLTPAAAKAGTRTVVRGTGWAQIEFCRPRVVLSLRGAVFARALVDDRLRFAVRWRVPALAPGSYRVVATQHCESGKDGSPVLVTRRVTLRVTA